MAITQQPSPATSIDPRTAIGELALTVADLDRSIDFYTGPLGFRLLSRVGGKETLGAGNTPLLHLTEQPGARPWPFPVCRGDRIFRHPQVNCYRATRPIGRWREHGIDHPGSAAQV